MLKKGGAWREAYGIDERKVASMVREDKIDILVELTGHTANNRLGVMACRPAPVQVLTIPDFVIQMFICVQIWTIFWILEASFCSLNFVILEASLSSC